MRPRTAKALDRTVLLVATVCLAACQYDVPNKTFWRQLPGGRGYLALCLILAVGAFGTFVPFQTVAVRRQVKRKAALRQQILTHFGRIQAITARSGLSLDLSDPGLHIWRIRRTLRHPISPRLSRLATYRLGSTPATRAFSPRKGTGVIGLAWKENKEVAINVAELAARIPDEQSYLRHRQANGDDAVMGMTWAEFCRVRHRGAVFASPVRNALGEFVGCVSVDTSHGFSSLATPDLWHEINALCAELGDDGLEDV